MNPDNPLGRRSGAGRNPAVKNTPRSGQNHDVVPLARVILNYLDTGLRRYDTVSSNGLFGMKSTAQTGSGMGRCSQSSCTKSTFRLLRSGRTLLQPARYDFRARISSW